jgi:hypothetical protein
MLFRLNSVGTEANTVSSVKSHGLRCPLRWPSSVVALPLTPPSLDILQPLAPPAQETLPKSRDPARKARNQTSNPRYEITPWYEIHSCSDADAKKNSGSHHCRHRGCLEPYNSSLQSKGSTVEVHKSAPSCDFQTHYDLASGRYKAQDGCDRAFPILPPIPVHSSLPHSLKMSLQFLLLFFVEIEGATSCRGTPFGVNPHSHSIPNQKFAAIPLFLLPFIKRNLVESRIAGDQQSAVPVCVGTASEDL